MNKQEMIKLKPGDIVELYSLDELAEKGFDLRGEKDGTKYCPNGKINVNEPEKCLIYVTKSMIKMLGKTIEVLSVDNVSNWPSVTAQADTQIELGLDPVIYSYYWDYKLIKKRV